MSVRGNPDGTATPLVGDGNLVPTPTPPPYEENKDAAKTIKIYPTHHGVKNHVPLCESSKSNIMRAVQDGNPAKLADLLDDPKEKALIDHQEWQGFTAVHFACMTTTTGAKYGQRDPDVIACGEMLIEAGCNVNVHAHDQWGYTPLMLAAMSHYPAVEMCNALLKANADLLAVDDYGGTALHATAYGSKVDQLKVLRNHPDFEKALPIKNKEGFTALDVAIEIYKKFEAKYELAPRFCELRLLLATGKGFPGPGEKLKGDGVDYTPNSKWYPPGTLSPASTAA
jgi:ankyrin repeat protein